MTSGKFIKLVKSKSFAKRWLEKFGEWIESVYNPNDETRNLYPENKMLGFT